MPSLNKIPAGAGIDVLCSLFRVGKDFHRGLGPVDHILVDDDFGQIFFVGRVKHRL